jgi:hypothetical protein
MVSFGCGPLYYAARGRAGAREHDSGERGSGEQGLLEKKPTNQRQSMTPAPAACSDSWRPDAAQAPPSHPYLSLSGCRRRVWMVCISLRPNDEVDLTVMTMVVLPPQLLPLCLFSSSFFVLNLQCKLNFNMVVFLSTNGWGTPWMWSPERH